MVELFDSQLELWEVFAVFAFSVTVLSAIYWWIGHKRLTALAYNTLALILTIPTVYLLVSDIQTVRSVNDNLNILNAGVVRQREVVEVRAYLASSARVLAERLLGFAEFCHNYDPLRNDPFVIIPEDVKEREQKSKLWTSEYEFSAEKCDKLDKYFYALDLLLFLPASVDLEQQGRIKEIVEIFDSTGVAFVSSFGEIYNLLDKETVGGAYKGIPFDELLPGWIDGVGEFPSLKQPARYRFDYDYETIVESLSRFRALDEAEIREFVPIGLPGNAWILFFVLSVALETSMLAVRAIRPQPIQGAVEAAQFAQDADNAATNSGNSAQQAANSATSSQMAAADADAARRQAQDAARLANEALAALEAARDRQQGREQPGS